MPARRWRFTSSAAGVSAGTYARRGRYFVGGYDLESNGPLNARLVFIGGAIAPILQTDPPFQSARVTKDVDGVAATGSAADHATLQNELRVRGFREATNTRHAHRWICPDAEASEFDLVPAGDHLGASGQLWDRVAIDTAIELSIEPTLLIRHASPSTFLALKWAAFSDRGKDDPSGSHDLEDIIGVVVSRPQITDEVRNAAASVLAFVRDWSVWLRDHLDRDDLLAANLSRSFDAASAMATARERIAELAAFP